jgi:hypothetical protein
MYLAVERCGELLFQVRAVTVYVDKQRNHDYEEKKDADYNPGDYEQTLHEENATRILPE